MWLTTAWIGLVALAALLIASGILRRRRRAALIASLSRHWGQWRDGERDMAAIAAYHLSRAAIGEAEGSLDDRTWADLTMDAVFTYLDRTESAIGQQLLYHRLRGAPMAQPLHAFDALVTRFSTDTRTRERAQAALLSLRNPGAYRLWVIAQLGTITVEPWYGLFPILTAVMLVATAAAPFWPPAVGVLVVGAIAGLVLRSTVAQDVRVAVESFRQIGPLLTSAEGLRSIASPTEATLDGPLTVDLPRLMRLQRMAAWSGPAPNGAGSGDLLARVGHLLAQLLFLDATALFVGARELQRCGSELQRVLAAVGDIDAAVSIASYRSTATGWTRPSFQPAGFQALLIGLRHPLVPDAVRNALSVTPPAGVLITGANMSGKSTFLRTAGVNVVLAQTISTCLAESYEAPPFVVRRCIGRADDPSSGKSYYLVEVEAVLGIVHAADSSTPHLFLFDELFRDTNAVERIAAGESVLVELVAPHADRWPTQHLVLAATHDDELVELLDGLYLPFHFADAVDETGVTFDFRLRPGPSTTRNAIALLRLRGAPRYLVSRALTRAAELERTRTRGR